jgi:hypothetical protein
VQHHAGRCAAAEVLTLANELDMPFSPEVLRGAAVSGCVSRLLWLCTVHNCELPSDITAYAATGGSIDMLMCSAAVCSISAQATALHVQAIWPYLSFCMLRSAPSAQKPVKQLLVLAICHCCSGCGSVPVPGTLQQSSRELQAAATF